MKANELMIGDLLRVNRDGLCIKKDTIVQVRGIDGDNKFEEKGLVGCAGCQPLDKTQFAGGIWLDYLDPIPLTPDILKKNGFVYNELPFVQAWEQFGLALYSGGNGYRIGCGNNVALIIDSVHELQHALRLCGIDKEIRL